jgi:hypothetical protein
MEFFECMEGKTDYQIINEYGAKTTIRLDKWVADVLQIELPNVHERLQLSYDKLLREKPQLTRRQKGSCIREMAELTANQYQDSKKKVLRWNDSDFDIFLSL